MTTPETHQTDQQPTSNQTFVLPLYGGKKGTARFRVPQTIDQMDSYCSTCSHIWVRTRHGDARRVKINGSVRRWKRDRTRIEVPCKYGLYEYFTLTARDINDVLIEA